MESAVRGFTLWHLERQRQTGRLSEVERDRRVLMLVRQRWNLSRQHVNRLIAGGEVARNLEPIGSTLTEGQARELVGLEPEQQREVWKELRRVKGHGGECIDAFHGINPNCRLSVLTDESAYSNDHQLKSPPTLTVIDGPIVFQKAGEA